MRRIQLNFPAKQNSSVSSLLKITVAGYRGSGPGYIASFAASTDCKPSAMPSKAHMAENRFSVSTPE